MQPVRAAFVYFGLIFATGFVLGAIRVSFVVPRLGVRTAELLEMSFLFLAILLSARNVVRHFALPPDVRTRLLVGGLALGLMMSSSR